MKKFLESNGLPTTLVNDLRPEPWAQMLNLYVRVVSECPLVFMDKTNYRFKWIKRATLVFRDISSVQFESKWNNIAWQWRLELKNGKTLKHNLTYGYSTAETEGVREMIVTTYPAQGSKR